jgi:predicted cobalt transporter CbtA
MNSYAPEPLSLDGKLGRERSIVMPKILPIAIIVGVIAGLLVGGFDNLFTVPVENRAIVLEEQRAAEAAGGAVLEEEPLVPIWVQSRIGEPVARALFGVILGLLFAGGYNLARRALPEWHPAALAVVMGAVGFWTVALFPFLKYPLNPPGVGDPETLLFRQLFQTLFFLLSIGGTVGVLLAIQKVKSITSPGSQRTKLYGFIAAAYIVFAVVIALALPGNPDPVPVPIDLLELFRVLAVIGHFLHWMLLGLGVALLIMWKQGSVETAPAVMSARGAGR